MQYGLGRSVMMTGMDLVSAFAPTSRLTIRSNFGRRPAADMGTEVVSRIARTATPIQMIRDNRRV